MSTLPIYSTWRYKHGGGYTIIATSLSFFIFEVSEVYFYVVFAVYFTKDRVYVWGGKEKFRFWKILSLVFLCFVLYLNRMMVKYLSR